MKISKQIKTELATAYNCAMQVSILDMKAPLRYLNQYIAENVSGYGTAADEKVKSREDYRKLLMKSRQQSKGMLFRAKIITPYRPKYINETTAQFLDEIMIEIGDKKNKHSIHLNMSCVFTYQSDKWQMVLFHGSMPDATSTTEDTFHIGEAEKKVKELEKVVAQRTLDLQAKNKELELEAALERVRTVTMAMNTASDILNICQVFFKELKALGFKDLRNALINFWDDKNGLLHDYDYSDFAGGNFAKLPYSSHPAFAEFQKKIRKAKDAFAKLVIKKDGLKSWQQRRRNSGEYKDSRLDKISALYYYFYSTGVGALGISTFNPISKEKVEMLKKFRNVFDLAYKRYVDIAKAEAQAREAQIEAALERVRSRSMAMHHTSELQEVIHTVHKELLNLNLTIDGGSFIVINRNVGPELRCWGSGGTANTSAEVQIPHFNMAFGKNLIEGIKGGPKFFTEEFSQQQKKNFFTKLFKQKPWADLPAKQKKQKLAAPGGYTRSVAVSKHTSIFIINHEGRKFTDTENDLLKRFAKVFEQTYTRFLDLQKAEAQAREAQIQLALERVRARTMAMHISNELGEVAVLLFKQVKELGIESYASGFNIWDKEHKNLVSWMSNPTGSINPPFEMPIHSHEQHRWIYDAWKKHEAFLEHDIKGKAIIKHYQFLRSFPLLDEAFNNSEAAGIKTPDRQVHNIATFSQGYLLFITLEPKPELRDIFIRFAKVFEQTYTRFLDLQKAEAQAREAQIEAALERVRAKTMAMQNSAELASTAELLFLEFQKLVQQQLIQTTIGIYNEAANEIEFRATHWEGGGLQVEQPAYGSMDEPTLLKPIAMAWRAKEKSLVVELSGKNLKGWVKYRNKMAGVSISSKDTNGKRVISIAFFSRGHLSLSSALPLPEETVKILERFANAFDGTYTRFLDLQNAEAQAREAQIEAALERVRSRSMAMHKSEELKEVIRLVLEQFIYLKINAEHAGFYIDYKAHDEMHIWLADPNIDPFFAILPYFDTPTWNSFLEAKTKRTTLHTDLLDFKEKNKFYKSLFKLFTVPEEAKKFYMQCKGLAVSTVLLDNVGLYIENFSGTPYSEEENKILIRFGKVFQQTYTRFLDLQKAEAQAREAQVEASLERVRSRTMAMRDSSELLQTAEILFDQMRLLGVELQGVAFAICDKDSMMVQKWTSIGIFSHPYNIDPGEQRMYEAWKKQSGMYEEVYEGEKQKKYFEAFMKIPAFREGLQKMIDAGHPIPAWQKNYAVPFQQGYLLIITTKPFEETQIFLRFGKVFEQTYTRFLDLQKAEANTKEAIKQAALDRIRADIAAMRTAKDLERITPLIWNELKILKVPFTRCGVFIMDNEKELIHTFLSTPDGKAIAAIHIPFSTPGKTRLIPENWKKKTPYTDHWTDNDFIDFATALKENHAFESSETYLSGIPHGGFYLHFLPFLQGMLYVGNPTQLHEDETNLIQVVADAFSSAYSRYEDFNKLEVAKKQVDNALAELQATQKQLIQSEKMASLGELTAGIAHEIQNPLNFVNNFSEVSNELIDEMKEELEKGNYDDAKEIADDVKQNLEKINHHGKRADAIVKGMLQHSRSSSGQKELTDINALCDEYLRLSYHGLRAKDKSFNAKFETDFDASLPKINVVQQDIGRVILNLINNAFYAVNERKKLNETGYEPTILVSTKRVNDKIEVSVKDNGTGIPEKIKDKIFQPFFTTKPTGSGTGLGLSLSYDIVKSHGGEIKIESKENEWTEFKILLPII
ncbi:MAG: nuclear transport factor 2 family protein [Bacteroidetes bacterium]|nr:nuclear transport factor 2 family protein [Bacteroidota bacterium]